MQKEKLNFGIYDFMFNFGLSPSELKIYAFIYAYGASEYGFYFGKRGYMADKCGVSMRTVDRSIPKLIALGLIEKVKKLGLHGLRCSPEKIPRKSNETQETEEKRLRLFPKQITPKYDVIDVGQGYFSMSREQYEALLALVPIETLETYVIKLERLLEGNMASGHRAPHSAYRTLKKWINADLSL